MPHRWLSVRPCARAARATARAPSGSRAAPSGAARAGSSTASSEGVEQRRTGLPRLGPQMSGRGPRSGPAASSMRPPATRTVETAASPILRGLRVGDPVGMLFCNHVEELDQTAAEPRGRLQAQAQRALASDAGIPEPVLDAPGVVVTLRERLDRLVVSAVTDSATSRAEISEPRTGSMKTALLRGCHTSDHGFAVVPTLGVGADVPNRGVAVTPAPTRAGSTV